MKRSALFDWQRRASANLVEHHGWTLPGWFQSAEQEAVAVRSGAGLADISFRAKFDGKIQPERNGWPLGANHYLTIGDPPLDPPPGAIDVTSVYANFLLAGPASRQVLSKLTSVPAFPNGSCAQSSVAHVHAILLHDDLPPIPAYHILISREYAESVWESILHAGHEFHLQPFGLKTLELLKA